MRFQRSITIMWALAASAWAFNSPAQAQVAGRVERSFNTYHVAVCPGPVSRGAARCFAHVVTDRAGNIIVNKSGNGRGPGGGGGGGGGGGTINPSGYHPADLWSAYKFTPSTAKPGPTSQVIAVVDAYGDSNAESDLGVYRSQFQLPACTTSNGCYKQVNQAGLQGNYPRDDTGWGEETALDLAMVSATCPNCKILLVEATSATYANLAAAENTAAALGAHAISNSYGGGESGSQSYERAYNHSGIAITVSSGDSGYASAPNFPASSPHVTAVGGTSLYRASNARGWTEMVWSGAGSGCSTVYNRPLWQTNMIDPLCGSRTVADVSADADPATGVAVYAHVTKRSAGWVVFGGTSVGAPLIAGIYGVNGGSVNYGSDPYSHTSVLFDVVGGSNGSCGGTYLCTGLQGYDGPSGLGTPDGTGAF